MLILAAILAIFVYGMIAAMLGTILPDLGARFHLTPKQNGTIAFVQAIGLIIASVGVGPLIDTEGKKVGMVLGLAIITLALFLLPRSTGYSNIMIYMFLLGLGGGIVVTGANALASDVNVAERGTTLNLLNLFFGLGGLATPFISANLMKRNSIRLCYTVAALTAVTLAINIATAMPAPTGARGFVFSLLLDVGPVLAQTGARSARPVSVPLRRLRGRRVELAGPSPHRARHPRIASPQHPLARLRPRPASRPRRHFAGSENRSR